MTIPRNLSLFAQGTFASGGVSIGNTTDPGAGNLSVTGTGKFGTTVSVGAATPSASGAGITFPATQSASTNVNTLDDYEEGTWTPSVGGTATYTAQTGTYTKIGNTVTAICDITINVLGTGTAVRVDGLPFSVSGTAGAFVYYFAGIATNMIYLAGTLSGTSVIFTGTSAAAATMTYQPTIFQNGARVSFVATYYTTT